MKKWIIVVLIVFVASACSATEYTLTDLGRGEAFGINDLGQITGWRPDPNGGQMIAFVWDKTTGFTDIGPSTGRVINNLGQVAGDGWIWSHQEGLSPLSSPEGFYPFSSGGINNNGQIAGSVRSNSATYKAVLWNSPSNFIDLGIPNGWSGWAYDINDSGTVVGEMTDGPTRNHAFTWDVSSGLVDIGDFDTPFARADGINDLGQIVGQYNPGGCRHAFLWSATNGLLDLGTLLGWQSNSQAVKTNNNGLVVGWSMAMPSNPVPHAFVWSQSDGMVDLGLLGGGNSGATDTNSRNQICGVFRDIDNLEHIALWEPVPVVSSLTGKVTLQDFKGDITSVRVYIELRKTGEPNVSNIIYLNATGSYTLNDIPKGQYNVAFKAGHWLGKTIHDVDLTNDVVGLNVSLINGDVDGDNGIDLSDQNLVKRANGSRSGHKKWNADADLDGSGKVDKADLAIVLRNFGKLGDL